MESIGSAGVVSKSFKVAVNMSAPPSSASAPTSPRLKKADYRLSVNSYDRTAAMIVALLIMLGTAVGGLAIVFFANKFTTTIEPIAFVPVEASSPNANQGFADQPEPPGVEDAPELSEPELATTLDALSSLTMDSDAVLGDEAFEAAQEMGRGKGAGDSRQAGPGGDGVVERVPRWERWKIRFEPASAAEFAEWLDRFGVRVGVVGRDNLLHLAWGFTAAAPQTEAAPAQKYVAWGQTVPADGPMPALTAQFARKAGVAEFGSIVLLFYPFEVESLLWTIEQKANKSGDPNRVRETVFTVVRKSDGFAFEVVSQKFF